MKEQVQCQSMQMVTLSLLKKEKQNTLNTVQTKYHEIKALQDDTI